MATSQVGLGVHGGMQMLMAPPVLPEMAGCVSSVRHALLGAGENPSLLLQSEELITHSETALLRLDEDDGALQEWGVMWAQIVCRSLPDEWPLGSTEHLWGDAEGGVTWLLAAGAGEGEDHITLHVPPSQRAVWRPLALVRASIIEIYLRDSGCAIQYVYKGTRHPAMASPCAGDLARADTPALHRPHVDAWYMPPDSNGTRFNSAAAIRWLVSGHAFSSRGAHSLLIGADAPKSAFGYSQGDRTDAWHGADELLTTASECVHGRCVQEMAACSRDAICRLAWDRFAANQGKVPWNLGDLVKYSERAEAPVGALVKCYSSKCICQANDKLAHAVRFEGVDGLSEDEINGVLALASRIGGTIRRAFGLEEGGLSSPTRSRESQSKRVAQGHSVTYLHGSFESELPAVHAKLLSCATRAHDSSGWGLLNASSVSVRTIELLEYLHASDSLGWHVDEQSAVTMLVMLSSPDDFEGGQLQHEVKGHSTPVIAAMARGDVTVYRSHQAHRVTPLTAGRRVVMAIELWHDLPGSSRVFEMDSSTGEPTATRGRPRRRYGQCPA